MAATMVSYPALSSAVRALKPREVASGARQASCARDPVVTAALEADLHAESPLATVFATSRRNIAPVTSPHTGSAPTLFFDCLSRKLTVFRLLRVSFNENMGQKCLDLTGKVRRTAAVP